MNAWIRCAAVLARFVPLSGGFLVLILLAGQPTEVVGGGAAWGGQTPSGIHFDAKLLTLALRGRFSLGLSNTLLPSSISDRGASIFERPAELHLFTGGGLISFDRSAVKILANSDQLLRVSSVLTGKDGSMVSTLQVEPDGFLYYTFDISVDACDSADLSLTWNHRHARYIQHSPLHWPPENIREIPFTDGTVLSTEAFIPYVWIGNDDHGIFWFCESQRGWGLSPGHNTIDVSVRRDSVISRFFFTSRRIQHGKTLHLEFGLQLTPVRDSVGSFFQWQMAPAKDANIGVPWPSPKSQKYYGLAEPVDRESFKSGVARSRASQRAVIPYVCLTYVSGAVPEFRDSVSQWQIPGLVDSTSSDVKQLGAPFWGVCPASDGWREFIVSRLTRDAADLDIDGYYIDNAVVFGCRNLLHGCGYMRDGIVQPTYAFRAYRRLFKELRDSLKKARGGKDPYLLIHCSGRMTACIFPFVDGYLTGEQFSSRYDGSYVSTIPPPQFRTEFKGDQWGVTAFFLPTFSRGNQNKADKTKEVFAYALLHNTSVWPVWCNVAEFDAMKEQLRKAGIAGATFVPYWKRISNGPLLISTFEGPMSTVIVALNPLSKPLDVSRNGLLEAAGVMGSNRQVTPPDSDTTIGVNVHFAPLQPVILIAR